MTGPVPPEYVEKLLRECQEDALHFGVIMLVVGVLIGLFTGWFWL